MITSRAPAVPKITEWCFGVTSCPHVKSKKWWAKAKTKDIILISTCLGVAASPMARAVATVAIADSIASLVNKMVNNMANNMVWLICCLVLLGSSLVPSCAYKVLPKWARIPLPLSRWKRIPTPSSKSSQCRTTRTEHLATSRAAIQSSILVIISSRLLQFLFLHKLFLFKGSSAEPDLQLTWWAFYWPNKLMALCHFRLMTPGSIAQHSNVSACLCQKTVRPCFL